MADVTASCRFKGVSQDVDAPFSWHVVEVTVPSGTLTNSQVDDILLPDEYPAGTRLLHAMIQTIDPIANASTCVADLERARQTIATGALDQVANLVAGNDLKTLDTTGFDIATGGAALADWADASNGLTAGTHVGRLNVEITPGGNYTQSELKFLVAVLAGRIEY